MNFIKPAKYADKAIYKPLEEFLGKLYLKAPNLSFEADGAFQIANAARDGYENVIFRVKVLNGNESVGQIEVEYMDFRRQGKQMVYTISSQRIKNKIHPRNAKATKLPNEAMKLAVKTFTPVTSDSEVSMAAKQKMASEVGGLRYQAERNAERLGSGMLVSLMELAMIVQSGGIPTMGAEITSMLNHHAFRNNLNSAKISRSIHEEYERGKGIVLREERDGTLTGIELTPTRGTAVTRYEDTYKLPELYQTKLAMLRILEHKQPADSIGVKFLIEDSNWYYMTSGEIITTS